MDKGKKDWSWLPKAMPGVARIVADRRREHGDEHVNLCWRRGVLLCEPGWFYAVEGPLALGVPWDDPELQAFAALRWQPGQALVIIRMPGATT